MFKKIKRKLLNNEGLALVDYLVIFAFAFPLAMIIPDLIFWGAGWIKVQSIANDTSQFLGEHGGGTLQTLAYLQERFAEAGLNPSQWDLILTQGPLTKGEQGMIRLESTYVFQSVQMLFHFEVPVYASATFTSNVFIR